MEKIPIVRPNISEYYEKVSKDIEKIIRSNMLTGVNIYVKEFEQKMADYIGVKYGVAVSSCSVGLMMLGIALFKKNSKILIPSFTFSATAYSMKILGYDVVFSDIDDTLCMIVPHKDSISHRKIDGILAVNVFGNMCDIESLTKLSKETKIPLIFDSAHSIGSRYNGLISGNFGTAEVFSFSPTKLITTMDGGFIATNDKKLYEDLIKIRNYGLDLNYNSDIAGMNGRMNEISACLGISQICDIDKFVTNRNYYARIYRNKLCDLPISFQKIGYGIVSSFKDFVIILYTQEERDLLMKFLSDRGIQTKKYFYPPIHRFPWASSEYSLKHTEYISERILCLPIYNIMDEKIIIRITDTIKEFFKK